MGTLEEAATELMALIEDVSGMKAAPDKPPESINMFPFAVAYPSTGELFQEGYKAYRNRAVLALEVHVGRSNLPTDVDALYPFLERVADVIMDPDNATLSGKVDTIVADEPSGGIPWTFGELDWGDTKTLGYRFLVKVKLKGAIA
jgi:hypothetical protein